MMVRIHFNQIKYKLNYKKRSQNKLNKSIRYLILNLFLNLNLKYLFHGQAKLISLLLNY